MINILLVSPAKASLGFNPIFPFEGIIGIKGDYHLEEWALYAGLGYGFETEEMHYNLGTKYQINPQLSLDAKYNNWYNYNLPGYISEEGAKVNLNYQRALGENLNLAIFNGEVKDEGEEIETIYFNCNYRRELYYSWGKEVHLFLDISSGQTDGDDIYYISNLKLPIKLGNYTIIPELGYIKGSDKLKPYYELEHYLIGHSQDKEGTKRINLRLERRFDSFSQSGIFGIEMMDLVTSINIGDILAEDEGIDDLSLNATVGIGLSYEMGPVDFRYKYFIDNKGEHRFKFNIVNSY